MKRSSFSNPGKPLARKTPMKPGSAPMKRAAKPMRAKSRTNAKRESGGEDKLCRLQPCYLQIPGCRNDIATVVPCHSNSLSRGKGMGIKVDDRFTVPGCAHCHHELDAGKNLDKEQRREIWEQAYVRWSKHRMEIYGI